METKFFEIRDHGTCIAAIGIQTSCENINEYSFLHLREGFDSDTVILLRPEQQEAHYDAFAWGKTRTMREAHFYIQQHWDELTNFSVVDVRYILGEVDAPAASEILDYLWRT